MLGQLSFIYVIMEQAFGLFVCALLLILNKALTLY
ncbi:hypothetical protein LMOSLCC2376_2159 [Listeria monocytogenes SLCC2376]|nr:hypothetical protein LMOSLCC2376_2159 [Listeria monocytogenes SLCC2376]